MLAAALNDHQTLGMSLYWGAYLEEPWIAPPGGNAASFHHSRRHLRFGAMLTPAQRKAALAGEIVPTERMSEL